MADVEPTGKTLGATIRGVDMSRTLDSEVLSNIRKALARYGVVRFPDRDLTPAAQKAFLEQFGNPIQSASWTIPTTPEVAVLSNIVVDGRNTGYIDAGMSWHKDMTSLTKPGYATMLYAIKVPVRNSRSLGSTHFVNCQAAYDDLPEDIKSKLETAVGLNSPEYYNGNVIKKGGARKAFAEKDKKRAPTLHPLVITHPVTGRKILYCDPGHVESIQGWPNNESDAMIEFLRDHQLQEKYEYVFEWTERDVLMWDNLCVLHRATLDYGPDEHRLMHRCMVSQPDDVSKPRFL